MLDNSLGGGGAAEAVALSFFTSDISPAKISDVPEKSFLGQLVLINYRAPGNSNFTHSYIYEAIFSPPNLPSSPSRGLLNNFICSDGEFTCIVKGRKFKICGVYYCQQNSQTHVCAHACLRMGLNTVRSGPDMITNKWINDFLKIKPPLLQGLNLQQIHDTIKHYGINPVITDCTGLSPASYLSVLASIIESGYGALLVFSTANNTEHVVTIFGHTQNSDEWHPQALPEYSGPSSAHYYPSSSWIDHFLIHDDNFGPYYTLSSRAFEADKNVRAHWIVGFY